MDFTGMSPEVARIVVDYYSTQSFYSFLFGILVIYVMALILISLVKVRKSKQYRQFKTDMYVAAKIGHYAIKDGLDLAEETENFKKWCKKRRMQYKPLDEVVEEELMERIADDRDKQTNKKVKQVKEE